MTDIPATYGSILAVLDGTAGSEAALRAGLGVARSFDAYLEALHVRIGAEQIVPAMTDALAGTGVAEVIKELEAVGERRADAARSLYGSLCVAPGIPQAEAGVAKPGFCVAFTETEGREEDEVAGRGRLFDLIVMGRPPEEEGSPFWPSLEAALFDSGRPVLVAPPGGPGTVGTKVAIGWNDTTQAARAVSAAVPFLGRAGQVTVVTVEDDRAADPAALAASLARRGITAATRRLGSESPVIDRILGIIGELDIDLFVMGAYGHSRLRELVLGGVTRSMITSANVPVLMAH